MENNKIIYVLNDDNSVQYIPYIIGNLTKTMGKLTSIKINDMYVYIFSEKGIAFTYNKPTCNTTTLSLASHIGEPFTNFNSEILSNSYLCLKLLEKDFIILAHNNLSGIINFNNIDSIPEVFILFVLDKLSNMRYIDKLFSIYPFLLVKIDGIINNLWNKYDTIVCISNEYKRLATLLKICLIYGEYSRLSNNITVLSDNY